MGKTVAFRPRGNDKLSESGVFPHDFGSEGREFRRISKIRGCKTPAHRFAVGQSLGSLSSLSLPNRIEYRRLEIGLAAARLLLALTALNLQFGIEVSGKVKLEVWTAMMSSLVPLLHMQQSPFRFFYLLFLIN